MLKLPAALLLASSLAVSACAATTEDVHAYAGNYALADGRVLTVTDDAGTLKAQIWKRGPTASNARIGETQAVTLHPSGFASFTSTGSPLHITFAQDDKGDVAQVTVTRQGAAMQGIARR